MVRGSRREGGIGSEYDGGIGRENARPCDRKAREREVERDRETRKRERKVKRYWAVGA